MKTNERKIKGELLFKIKNKIKRTKLNKNKIYKPN